jgi:hypothetical protein
VDAEVAEEGSRLKYTFAGHAVRWTVTLAPDQRKIMSAETLSALSIRNEEYCILRPGLRRLNVRKMERSGSVDELHSDHVLRPWRRTLKSHVGVVTCISYISLNYSVDQWVLPVPVNDQSMVEDTNF